MKENHWLVQLPRVNQLSLNLHHDERWLHKLPSSLKYLCNYFPFSQAIVSTHSISKSSNPPSTLTTKTCNFKTTTNNDPYIFIIFIQIIKIITINTNQLSSAIFLCITHKLIPSAAQLLSSHRPAWKSWSTCHNRCNFHYCRCCRFDLYEALASWIFPHVHFDGASGMNCRVDNRRTNSYYFFGPFCSASRLLLFLVPCTRAYGCFMGC